jgi:hypothetical protein
MRARWWFVGIAALGAALAASALHTPPRAAAPEPAQDVGGQVKKDAPLNPLLEPAELTARELAEHLGISVWTFHYSGGRVRCWLEIDEDGKTTIHPVGGVQDPNRDNPKAREGKILLWVKRGAISLRVHSGASSGGFGMGLPQDALWWGWKSYSTLSNAPNPRVTPGHDREATLVNYVVTESKDDAKTPGAPRQIALRLKAAFSEDQP